LISAFTLEGISGGNAVFNPDKLDWFNQQHIALLAPEELVRRVRPLFEAAGLWQDDLAGDRRAWFLAVLDLLKPRAKHLGDFVVHGGFFFTDGVEYEAEAVRKYLQLDGMNQHLEAVNAAFSGLASFDAGSVEAALRSVADARGVKAAALIHAVRVSITGRSVSPGLFEVLALVGRQRVATRLTAGLKLASAAPAQ
jgi:glutamyl/glutaminyl-tRNA synthetase